MKRPISTLALIAALSACGGGSKTSPEVSSPGSGVGEQKMAAVERVVILGLARGDKLAALGCYDMAARKLMSDDACLTGVAERDEVRIVGGEVATAEKVVAAIPETPDMPPEKHTYLKLPASAIKPDDVTLAVWPRDAQVKPQSFAGGSEAPAELGKQMKATLAAADKSASGNFSAHLDAVVDIDGDGEPDKLYLAFFEKEEDPFTSSRGVFAELSRAPGKLELIDQPITPGPGSGRYSLVAALDLDGDGAYELITHGSWNHGYSLELQAFRGGKLEFIGGIGYDE